MRSWRPPQGALRLDQAALHGRQEAALLPKCAIGISPHQHQAQAFERLGGLSINEGQKSVILTYWAPYPDLSEIGPPAVAQLSAGEARLAFAAGAKRILLSMAGIADIPAIAGDLSRSSRRASSRIHGMRLSRRWGGEPVCILAQGDPKPSAELNTLVVGGIDSAASDS